MDSAGKHGANLRKGQTLRARLITRCLSRTLRRRRSRGLQRTWFTGLDIARCIGPMRNRVRNPHLLRQQQQKREQGGKQGSTSIHNLAMAGVIPFGKRSL